MSVAFLLALPILFPFPFPFPFLIMLPIVSYPNGSPIPSTGLGGIVNGVKKAYCDYLNNGPFILPPGTPADFLRRGVKDAIGCTPPPENPNDPQFLNDPRGKCAGKRYRITLSGSYEQKIGQRWEVRPWNRVTQAYGPIGSIVRSQGATDNNWVYRANVGTSATNPSPVNALLFDAFANKQDVVRNANYSIDIATVDGSPDVCQNPAPTYPPTPPRDGPGSPTPYAFPPIIIIPISPTVNIPVTISPNITVNGTVNFRVADSIDIQIGPKSIDVYLAPSVNIDLFPDAPAPGYELPPGFPDEPTGNDGSEGDSVDFGDEFGAINDQIDDLRELLEEVKACSCETDPPQNITEQIVAIANNGSLAVPVNCVAIKVRLVDLPDTPKMEWGGGNAPDVYYAGWASFGRFLGQSTRQPLDFGTKLFIPFKGASSFAWTCRQFYSAEVSLVLSNPVA